MYVGMTRAVHSLEMPVSLPLPGGESLTAARVLAQRLGGQGRTWLSTSVAKRRCGRSVIRTGILSGVRVMPGRWILVRAMRLTLLPLRSLWS